MLRLDTPIPHCEHRFKYHTCPSLEGAAKTPISKSQISESRNLLRTCHQIREEGKPVFYEVNSWGLDRAILRETPAPWSTIDDTAKLFAELHQIKAVKHFQHVNMRIFLFPLAYCDLLIPDGFTLGEALEYIHSQRPSLIAFHRLDEAAQSELFRTALMCLVDNQSLDFPELRSVTLEVSLHKNKIIRDDPDKSLECCGITFYIKIVLAPDNGIHTPYSLQLAKCDPRNQRLYARLVTGDCIKSFRDPTRQMLSPLTQLEGVQRVEIERRWTISYNYRQDLKKPIVVRVQPLRQLWRFYNVKEMLERAGPEFAECSDWALEYLKIPVEDVIQIIENTPEEVEYKLIP